MNHNCGTNCLYQKREKEQKDKITEQDTRDALRSKREADRIFSEKQHLKARKIREDERKLRDYNTAQLVIIREENPLFKAEQLGQVLF